MEQASFHGKRAIDICQSKTRYKAKIGAEQIARSRMMQTGIQLYTYKCEVCAEWHLTKKQKSGTGFKVEKIPKESNDVPQGFRFGRFTVVEKVGTIPARYECLCDCGEKEVRRGGAIRNQKNWHDCCAKCKNAITRERNAIYERTGEVVDSYSVFNMLFCGKV